MRNTLLTRFNQSSWPMKLGVIATVGWGLLLGVFTARLLMPAPSKMSLPKRQQGSDPPEKPPTLRSAGDLEPPTAVAPPAWLMAGVPSSPTPSCPSGRRTRSRASWPTLADDAGVGGGASSGGRPRCGASGVPSLGGF